MPTTLRRYATAQELNAWRLWEVTRKSRSKPEDVLQMLQAIDCESIIENYKRLYETHATFRAQFLPIE